MRTGPLLRLLAALAAAVTLLAACGDDAEEAGGDAGEGTTTSRDPTSTGAPSATCTDPDAGFTVEYPRDWSVNDTSEDDPCRWFHPEEFDLPRAQEATEIAIHLQVLDAAFGEQVAAMDGSPAADVTAREETEVNGHQAVRFETVSTGEALTPEGVRGVTWVVNVDGHVLTTTTLDVAGAGTFADNVKTLDAMMRSLRFDTGDGSDDSAGADPEGAEPGRCSAAGLDAEPEPQPELPDEVADVRRRIVRLAVRCDIDALADYARRGEFTASFGGNRADRLWRRQEQQGSEPLRYLVALLDRPFGTEQVQGETQYVWPSAFAYDSWSDVPREDREALKPLYTEEDFEGFEDFGSYVGYRVGIVSAGDWIFFVEGD